MDTNPVLMFGLLLLYIGLPVLCVASFAHKLTRLMDLWRPSDGRQRGAGLALKGSVQASSQPLERQEENLMGWHASTG